jgi:uncharacterized protein YjbI with pentapeptide repeats
VTVEAPLPPRSPEVAAELPRADRDELIANRAADEVELAGLELRGFTLPNLRLRGSRLRAVELDEATLTGLDAADVVVADGSWANIRLEECSIARLEAVGLRATGAAFTESRLADATFADCRLDLASFRFAELDRVAFRDCRLEEADFYGATLRSVRFERCTLTGASLETATLARCELRGCDLAELRGVERLAGARMPLPDLVQIAGLLAAASGIEVVD